jgi:very-short-patch-repair endonuclease
MLSNEQFIEECRESIRVWADEEFCWHLDMLGEKCESPIEKRLLAGMICHLDTHGLGYIAFLDSPWTTRDDADVKVQMQAKVGEYRTDFLITMKGGQRIIVECDGHDYHERTKEQARRDKSRDRWFVAQNIRVLRFTGSEIYRDTENCVAEIANLIEAEYKRDSLHSVPANGPRAA